jgi:Phage P22-like portal protein
MDNDKLASTPDDIIRECRERMRLATDAEANNRSEAEGALRFRNGEQWPDNIQSDRTNDGRPCLTINLTDAVVRRVENACRENRPRIKIDPVGDGADVDVARVLNGLTRHVEAISGADYAYDCATSSAITGGWGWVSVTNDYADEESFDQELFICPHRNPFKIYADPSSELPDGSDLTWLIESEMMKRTDYKDQYGHLDGDGWKFMGAGDDMSDWSHKEEIRVAKYWRVENKKDTLVKLSDGRTLLKSKLPDDTALTYAGLTIIQERPTVRRAVKCYLMTAYKILKEWDWPGRWIPYVPIYGRELDINGKIKRKGMVKDLMDPARMYNFSETAKTEVYALQPKAPWLMAEGSMEGHEPAWRDANRKPVVALEYKPKYGDNGEMLPPPIRQEPPPLGAGFQEWSQTSQSNFMAVAGMPHDPNQDAKGEVVSGIALKRRQGLSDVSHFDFYDNLTRSLRQLGRILVGLYPHFYSTPRMQRIVREDGTSEMVGINQPTQEQDEQGNPYITIKNNLQVGRYDVIVDTGPGYQTKREESTEAKLELLATPLGEMVGAHAGDLVIRGMDFENSDEIADRLQASIPGAISEKGLKDMPPKARAMISGLQAQLKQAQQQLQQAGLELKFKHGIEKMKQDGETERLKYKEGMETQREAAALHTKVHDVDTKSHVAMHDTHVKAQASIVVAETAAAAKLMDSHADRKHEREMGERELEHVEEMTGVQHQHESTESAKDRASAKVSKETK